MAGRGSLTQLGYGSGVPGSPTHVPGFIVPGDGTPGLPVNLLTLASGAPANYDVAFYDYATYDDATGTPSPLSSQTATRGTLVPV